jgi:hypothetical protein
LQQLLVARRKAVRGLDDLTDGLAHRADLAADLAPGVGRQRRQTPHLVRHHREAAPLLAGTGRLDGGIDGQQIGLVGNRADQLGHLAQLGGDAAQALDARQHLLLGLHGQLQPAGHLAQLALGRGEHRRAAAATVATGLGEQAQGLLQPLLDGAELARQRTDRDLALRGRAVDLAAPDRQRLRAQRFQVFVPAARGCAAAPCAAGAARASPPQAQQAQQQQAGGPEAGPGSEAAAPAAPTSRGQAGRASAPAPRPGKVSVGEGSGFMQPMLGRSAGRRYKARSFHAFRAR